MPKIGVIGPESSVTRILSVAARMEHKLEFLPLHYEIFTEAAELVRAHRSRVDGWLFSGPSPYMAARECLEPDAVAVSCQHFGAGLYRGLLNLSQQLGRLPIRVSIDMPQEEGIVDNIEEALQELQLPTEHMHVKPYHKEYEPEELLRFHRELYRGGLTEGAVVSLYSLHQAMQREGIPSVHNTITKMEIKQAIQTLMEKADAAYFRKTQAAVNLFDVEVFRDIGASGITPYQLLERELDVRRVLIRLSRKFGGYLLEKGSGRYEIFSSRGAVERELPSMAAAVAEMAAFAEAAAHAGIGFGESVHAAEIHAVRAVSHGKAKGCTVVMIEEDGVITEAPGVERELQYSCSTRNGALLEKLRGAGVSVKIYQKLAAVTHRMGWTVFTAAQAAAQLRVTSRNVSRILAGLATVGLAECVGQEAGAERGRPSQLFRLTGE